MGLLLALPMVLKHSIFIMKWLTFIYLYNSEYRFDMKGMKFFHYKLEELRKMGGANQIKQWKSNALKEENKRKTNKETNCSFVYQESVSTFIWVCMEKFFLCVSSSLVIMLCPVPLLKLGFDIFEENV